MGQNQILNLLGKNFLFKTLSINSFFFVFRKEKQEFITEKWKNKKYVRKEVVSPKQEWTWKSILNIEIGLTHLQKFLTAEFSSESNFLFLKKKKNYFFITLISFN